MAQVVGVHGIAQEHLGRNQLLSAWSDGLADGVEIAYGRDRAAPSLDLAFYGHLFLTDADRGAQVMKGVADELLPGLTDDEAAFVAAAADEVAASEVAAAVIAADEVAADEVAADVAGEFKGFHAVPGPLQPLVGGLSRRYNLSSSLGFIAALKQVKAYLDDDALAELVRASVAKLIGADSKVLVAHSLGTVVAVETLALDPQISIDTLVTMGSPLSMRTIASRLRGISPEHLVGHQVRRWVNILDPKDPVAGAGPLNRLWRAVEEFEVGNGKEPHSAVRYLSKKAAGQAVVEGVGSP